MPLSRGHFSWFTTSRGPVAASDWPRIADLVATYRDLPLGTVDASVVATAERMAVNEVATLDRRHFTVVRPVTGDFRLVPGL